MDLSLFYALNKLVATNGFLATIIELLSENPLLRGAPVFFYIFYLWFSTNDILVKTRFLLGFIACIVGVVISVFCQTHLHLHIRPIFDDHLGIVNVLKWTKDSANRRIYSFPSDTATLYFALVMIILLENKKLGFILFIWAIITAGICRVAVGIHYPSDIIGGIILGSGLVLAFSTVKKVNMRVAKLISRYDPKFIKLNIFIFLFAAEAYNQFPGLTQLFYIVVQLLKGTPA
jgi:membrane-associated phospholipid phosphatase